jgi:hypothetical protein
MQPRQLQQGTSTRCCHALLMMRHAAHVLLAPTRGKAYTASPAANSSTLESYARPCRPTTT